MSSDATTFPLRDTPLGGPSAAQPRSGAGARAGAQTRRANTIATAALAAIVLCGALIVIVAANRPTFAPTHAHFFPGWLAGPLGGLWPGFPRGTLAVKYVFTLSLGAMYLSYLLSLKYVPQLRAGWAIGAIVAVHVLLFLAPPLALTDIFNYVNYGRMEIVHHLNPYTTTPVLEPHNDPSYDLSNWHHLLSPYGPLFTMMTFALVPLGVAASFWAIKAILMAASLGTLVLIWQSARLLERDPVQAIVFVGLNPVVLVWGMGGDHNDFVMIFLIALGFYLLLRAGVGCGAGAGTLKPPTASAGSDGVRAPAGAWPASAPFELGAGAAFVTAVAVKASAGILVPVVLAALLRDRGALARVALGMLTAGALLAVCSVTAFGLHLPDLSTQGRLVTNVSVPNLLGLALGSGGETDALRHVLSVVLVASVLLSCVLAWRRRDAITPSGWATVALLVTLSWVLPWYVIWVLPMAALSRSRALRTTALALGVYLMLAWAPLTANVFNAIGFHPDKTSLGRLHQRYVKELLN